jgi:sulfate adenylyltransferase
MNEFYGYGGNKIVNRLFSDIKVHYTKKIKYELSHDQYLTVARIADGSFSPLTGFMNKAEVLSILKNKKLTNGLVWTIPIMLPALELKIDELKDLEVIELFYPADKFIGIVVIEEIFKMNILEMLINIFNTDNPKHPGVNKMLNEGEYFIAGDIFIVDEYKDELDKYCLKPIEVQNLIRTKGFKTVAGFQTRNVPHRAHEYLQRIAMETLDGILIHPILGWKKTGDYNPELIVRCYNELIKQYYNTEIVILSGLRMNMFYAGPLEAVLHSIVRKNYGCTHFIVGRDHAGVGDFYDKYAAHKIFDTIKPKGIEPFLLNGPHYCSKCNSIVTDKICKHGNEFIEEISGTKMRQLISEKQYPPEYYMRKEICDIIFETENKFL